MQTIRLFLSLALILFVVSISPMSDDWQVLVRIQPSIPAASELSQARYAPHEALAMGVVDGWQSMINSFVGSGWLTAERAQRLVSDGLDMTQFLQLLAALLGLLAWLRSFRSEKDGDPLSKETPTPDSRSEAASSETMREPRLVDEPALGLLTIEEAASDSGSVVDGSPDHETARREAWMEKMGSQLTDLQMRLTNTTLNPLAQPVVEPLMDIGRSLQRMRSELEREMNDSALTKERSVR
jgi:hypothetical protein